MSKINSGQWGEGIDILMNGLDSMAPDTASRVVADIQNKLADGGYKEASNHLSSLLAYTDLGMDVDFFNTGQNSPGDVPEPDVKVNRQPIEAHFAGERHKPEMHVQPFLGTSYG